MKTLYSLFNQSLCSLPSPTVFLLMVVTIFSLSSCLEESSNSADSSKGDDNGKPPPVKTPEKKITGTDIDFIGLTLKDGEALAKSRKLPSRVIEVDGKARFVTLDYNPGRINFTVEKGKIVKTKRG